jgi:hypothetical protein
VRTHERETASAIRRGRVRFHQRLLGGLGADDPDECGGQRGRHARRGVDSEAANAVVAANMKALEPCFRQEADRKPGLTASIRFVFDIGNDGRVADLQIIHRHQQIRSGPLRECLLTELKKWPFKAFEGQRVTLGLLYMSGGVEPMATGSLNKELIRQAIQRNIGEIRDCYEAELSDYPKLSGKVSVKFIITAQGTVSSSTVDNATTNNADLESCVGVSDASIPGRVHLIARFRVPLGAANESEVTRLLRED